MRVSEVTEKDLANYMRLDYDDLSEEDINFIMSSKAAAVAFIRSYAGIDDSDIDTHEEMVIVVYVLVQDMYDNRSMYIEKAEINKVVETILGMYATNLL